MSAPAAPPPPWHKRVEATAALYCLSFVALGCSVAALGPAILELSLQINETVTVTAYVQGIRGFAYLAGSFCGPLYDRIPGHRIMATALLFGGLATGLLGVPSGWWGLAAVCVLQGFSMCCVDTGGNVLLLALLEGHPKMGVWMQALHFCFALGAFVAPLLLRIAESAKVAAGSDPGSKVEHDGSYGKAFWTMGAACILLAVCFLAFPSPRKRKTAGVGEAGTHDSDRVLDDKRADVVDTTPIDNPVVLSPEPDKGQQAPDAPRAHAEIAGPLDQASPPPVPSPSSQREIWMVVLITSAMLGAYVGTETGYGFFATAYAVFSMNESEAVGQYLTSAFWGFLTLGRFAAIPLSSRFTPERMLTVNLLGCVAAVVCLLLFQGVSVAVWIFTCAFGFFMACIFPSTMSLVESYFPIQGKHATAFVVGCALGEWAFPFIISTFIGGTVTESGEVQLSGSGPGPQIVLWIALLGSLLTFGGYVILRKRGTQLKRRLDALVAGGSGTATTRTS